MQVGMQAKYGKKDIAALIEKDLEAKGYEVQGKVEFNKELSNPMGVPSVFATKIEAVVDITQTIPQQVRG